MSKIILQLSLLIPTLGFAQSYSIDWLKPMKYPLKNICPLLTLAWLAFWPAGAVADTLYATWGNGLYQFNTALGAGSQSTATNFSGTVIAAMAVDTHGNLFVATDGNFSTDFGDIYEITTNGLTHEIATGLDYPAGLAVDSSGDLFEVDANGDNTSINEFISTDGILSSTPVTFASGFGGADPLNALAFDGSGDLFVTSYGGTYEFTNNAGTLSTQATLVNFHGAAGLAFDSSGDLVLGNAVGYTGILEFINTAGTPSSTPLTVSSSLNAYSMAFDSQGNLFVSDLASGNGNIYEFSNNGGTLSSTPVTFASGLYASGLAFLPVAPPPKLYVAGEEPNWPYTHSIYSFAPPAGSGSQRTIASGFSFKPAGMAVDSQGNLFASDGVSAIYEVQKNGVPVTIASGLNDPTGLAFDTNGDLFELDNGSFSVNKFINTAGTLSSTPTRFPVFAYGDILLFDSHGNLYVQESGSIEEYPNDHGTLSTQAVAPSFTVDGIPTSLVFDANGDLFVGYNGVILEYGNNNSAAWYNGGVPSSTPITIANVNVAGLACDPSGNLYEVDGDDGNVYEFANNAGTLLSTRTLYASGLGATREAIYLSVPTTVAPQPNMYVTDGNHNLIYSFNTTNGAATQALYGGTGVGGTSLGSLAFDNYGDLFISDYYYLYEVTNNAGTLSESNQIPISEAGVSFGCGGGVAFDFSGNLFVGDYMYPGINKLTPTATPGIWNNFPSGDPNPFLAGGGFAYSLAFDNNRANLFDEGGGYLMEFGNLSAPPGQTSRVIFPAPIYGSYEGGVAVDGNGNLFAGEGAYGIFEFTNTPTGVSTNQSFFAGGLSDVSSLAFDASGNLFAADGTSGKVYEFINTGGVLSGIPVLFASGLGDVAGLAIYTGPGVPVPPAMAVVFHPPGGGSGSMPGQMVFSWPSSSSGFVIQTNGSLLTPNWANYGGTVQSYQGTSSVTITSQPAGNLFFRLAHP